MLTCVEAIVQNGVVKLLEPVTLQEGTRVVVTVLPQPELSQSVLLQPLSKWAALVQRNKQHPLSLGLYTEQDRKDRQEFRENFQDET
ncbi:antitoxin family protein [Deltaproteobacteria bacterium TL4]